MRDLLRKGLIKQAYQPGGKGSEWIIPHSSYRMNENIIIDKKVKHGERANPLNNEEIKKDIRAARLKYKPTTIKCLLIAEAPPEALERFFYYEDVKDKDFLFIGLMQALYPDYKDEYLSNGRNTGLKKELLEKFKADGYYLIDLSDLPISMISGKSGDEIEEIKTVINELITPKTPIILIKANIYDALYSKLKMAGYNVINNRIPFPSTGGQKKFQIQFKEALSTI
ncbi:MAG: hypothetical protein P4L45_10555 [Ignavibacteriaceae bacterium]|nr:hypothetical protein [Ignavibacteriaceae bacterium]